MNYKIESYRALVFILCTGFLLQPIAVAAHDIPTPDISTQEQSVVQGEYIPETDAPADEVSTSADANSFEKVLAIREQLQQILQEMAELKIRYQELIHKSHLTFTPEEQKQFFDWINAINKAVVDHLPLLEEYKEQELLHAIHFVQSLMKLHYKALKFSLKKLPRIAFPKEEPTRAIPTIEQLEKELANAIEFFQKKLVPELITCGMSLKEKINFFWQKTNNRFGITRKAGYGFAGFLSFGILRYFTKNHEIFYNYQRDENNRKYENFTPKICHNFYEMWPSWLQNTFNSIDDHIYGEPKKYYGPNGPFYEGKYDQEKKSLGAFIHNVGPLILFMATVPSILAAFPEALKQKYQDWLMLFNNPAHFFGFGTNALTPVKNEHKNYYFEAIMPTFGFERIIGLRQIKMKLMGKIMSQSQSISACLLYGPPGCGKTEMFRAVGGEIAKMYQRVVCLKVKPLILNKTTFAGLLEAANAIYPGYRIVLFIDEIDMYQPQRNSNAVNLIDLVETLSGVNSQNFSNIFIIAATNRADLLDDALIRHGRFGDILVFEKPSFDERYAYFQASYERYDIPVDPSTLARAAHATAICSFSDLAVVFEQSLQNAFQEALAHQQDLSVQQAFDSQMSLMRIEFRHISQAINNLIHQVHMIAKPLPVQEQRVVSLHLAAQVLTNALLDTKQILYQATILPVQKPIQEQHIGEAQATKSKELINHGGVFFLPEPDSAGFIYASSIITQAKVLLAGSIGEEIGTGMASGHKYRSEDREVAFEKLEKLKFAGFTNKGMSETLKTQFISQVFDDIKQYEQEVRTLLTTHKHTLIALAQHLEEHQFITPEDLQKLIQSTRTIHPSIHSAEAEHSG